MVLCEHGLNKYKCRICKKVREATNETNLPTAIAYAKHGLKACRCDVCLDAYPPESNGRRCSNQGCNGTIR